MNTLHTVGADVARVSSLPFSQVMHWALQAALFSIRVS